MEVIAAGTSRIMYRLAGPKLQLDAFMNFVQDTGEFADLLQKLRLRRLRNTAEFEDLTRKLDKLHKISAAGMQGRDAYYCAPPTALDVLRDLIQEPKQEHPMTKRELAAQQKIFPKTAPQHA